MKLGLLTGHYVVPVLLPAVDAVQTPTHLSYLLLGWLGALPWVRCIRTPSVASDRGITQTGVNIKQDFIGSYK